MSLDQKIQNKLIELKKNLMSVIFEGAELEGLGLTYAKTEEIINNPKLSNDKYSFNQVQAVVSMKHAYEYVVDFIQNNKKVNVSTTKELNKIIDSYEEPNLAGKWRERQNSIGGTYYIPEVFPIAYYEKMIEKSINEPIWFAKIINLYVDMTRSQCFADGNKRTALVFCNLILVQNGLDFIKILNHHLFKRKLVNCYENIDGSIEDFTSYVIKTSKFMKISEVHASTVNNEKSFISIGALIKKSQYDELAELAKSQKSTVGKMLKQYIVGLSLGSTHNFHLYPKEQANKTPPNSATKWVGCQIKKDLHSKLQSFAKQHNLTLYQIIKGWSQSQTQ
ncbi:MAG: Fic family protein [Mycoplasmataceae bacterium]|nr:Fic family protein [Mycoplasmataceae bacterium]